MAKWMLVPIIVVLMGFVVVSLVRGVVTFLRASREEIDRGGDGPSPNQLRQNQLMFARVKYQGLAVLVVIILLAASR
jgi:hypothetical protein